MIFPRNICLCAIALTFWASYHKSMYELLIRKIILFKIKTGDMNCNETTDCIKSQLDFC